MAYRRSRGKDRKMQPAVHTITVKTDSVTSGETGTFYCDLSQIASLVNRRFYRQGIQWAVAGFKTASAVGGVVQIGKLPNTWIMSNSWEKGFRSWQEMNKTATEELPSIKPKFLDFKIYADAAHHAAGFDANLLPLDYGAAPYQAGEWVPSKYSIPRTDGTDTAISREIIAVGANYPGVGSSGFEAVSLIEGYAASRALPTAESDPNMPDDASDVSGNTPENWMGALKNDGIRQDEVVVEDMLTENNQAPYPFEGDKAGALDTMYPGGSNQAPTLEWHDTGIIFASRTDVNGNAAGFGAVNMKGGMFPCGLIRFDWTPVTSANLVLQIDLVPGDHRGYLCAPMTDM